MSFLRRTQVSSRSLDGYLRVLLTQHVRPFSSAHGANPEASFEYKRNRANRAKRQDRIKSAVRKAGDKVTAHNERHPDTPITIEDVGVDVHTPSYKRRQQMRKAVREALEQGDTGNISLLVSFLKKMHNLNPDEKDTLQMHADRQAEEKRQELLKKEAPVLSVLEEAAKPVKVMATSILNKNRVSEKNANYHQISDAEKRQAQETKRLDRLRHFLLPGVGSLGQDTGVYHEGAVLEQEMQAGGADIENLGLNKPAGSVEEGIVPRATSVISGRKARFIEEIANCTSITLMRKQFSGKDGFVQYDANTMPKHEISLLRKDGVEGKQLERKIEKLSGKKIKVGFVDLYQLGFFITRVSISRDMSHATIHWNAPCLMPLSETNTKLMETPVGNIVDAVQLGLSSASKFLQANAAYGVPLKDDMKALEWTEKSFLETKDQKERTKQTIVDVKDGTEASKYTGMSAEEMQRSLDGDNKSAVFFDRDGIAYKRKPDGDVVLTTIGDPSLWAKRSAFAGAYVGGTIDPLPPTAMYGNQLNTEQGKSVQFHGKSSLTNVISGNKETTHKRASGIIVTHVSRYLDHVIPSLRWMQGENLQLKYVMNIRFEFDSHYGEIKSRARSIGAAMQDFFQEQEKTNSKDQEAAIMMMKKDAFLAQADKLRRTAKLAKDGFVEEDNIADEDSMFTPAEEKVVIAARLLGIDPEELELLHDEELDAIINQQSMFSRMIEVEEDQVAQVLSGALNDPVAQQKDYELWMKKRKEDKEEKKLNKQVEQHDVLQSKMSALKAELGDSYNINRDNAEEDEEEEFAWSDAEAGSSESDVVEEIEVDNNNKKKTFTITFKK